MKSRQNFTSDYDAGFWARLVIGLRTVSVAGCGMARKRSARWTLWLCTRTMVSSGFTRSICLLNCLKLTKHAQADQSSFNSNCIRLNHIFNFGILIHLSTYLPVSIMHYLHKLPDWWESSKQYGLELPPLPLLLTTQINNIGILHSDAKTIGLNGAWGMRQFKAFLWYFISRQMSFRVKLSLYNLILIHSKTRKSHKNTVKMSIFQKN